MSGESGKVSGEKIYSETKIGMISAAAFSLLYITAQLPENTLSSSVQVSIFFFLFVFRPHCTY